MKKPKQGLTSPVGEILPEMWPTRPAPHSGGRAWGRRNQNDPDNGWDDSGRESWEMPESLIIGKAFCVSWPHHKPAWPEFRLGPDQRFPVRPYIERIHWIR